MQGYYDKQYGSAKTVGLENPYRVIVAYFRSLLISNNGGRASGRIPLMPLLTEPSQVNPLRLPGGRQAWSGNNRTKYAISTK
jgi:hypothetical protein